MSGKVEYVDHRLSTHEDVNHRLSTHEEVCSLRYEAINSRLKRLESILMASAGAIILLLLSIVLK